MNVSCHYFNDLMDYCIVHMNDLAQIRTKRKCTKHIRQERETVDQNLKLYVG